MEPFSDVIVIGLGAAGSAAIYHLSKTDQQVIGIDRYTPPHIFGSSHGESRIIRQAYFESPMYVPFVQQALCEWRELEQLSNRQLFLRNGSLMLGASDSEVILGTLKSAAEYGLGYTYLDSTALQSHFPALIPAANTVAVLEEEAGLLFPEACIAAHLELALKNGVTMKFNEQVLAIEQIEGGINVRTDQGNYKTRKVIVSTGAWADELLGDLNLPLEIERRVVHWFKPKNTTFNNESTNHKNFLPEQLPVYIWEYEPGKMFYGFPDLGNGLKIANTKKGKISLPDQLDREVSPEEIKEVEQLVARYFSMDAVHAGASVCMYTNTPDEHFIIDVHPLYSNVILTSPCSGHGFKFSSMTGKILAQMAMEQQPDLDLSPFRIARFIAQ